jgi:cation diffusion facilitator family transporter
MYRARLKAGIISIVVGASVCSIKFAGFFATDSYAILSDALESIINVVAASFAAYTIVQSSRKADHEHPYGRGRLEYFSAGIEGSLILLAGVLILRESVPRLFTGHQVSRMDLGLLFTGVGTVANALLAVYLGRVGRKNHSAALEADGKHVMSDVVSSVGLFLGLLLVALTDYPWMDPLVASIMALWILFTGFQLIRHSYHQLMDRASPEVIQAVTKALSDARIPEMIRPHRLRLRESGSYVLVDFHLIVPRYFTVKQLHALEERIHHHLTESMDRPVDLLLHNDACSPSDCNYCGVKRCPVRKEKQRTTVTWGSDELLNDIRHVKTHAAED